MGWAELIKAGSYIIDTGTRGDLTRICRIQKRSQTLSSAVLWQGELNPSEAHSSV